MIARRQRNADKIEGKENECEENGIKIARPFSLKGE